VPLPSSAVPPALHASLIARLDRLGPTAREIAQIGAVLGREFSYELIALVAQSRRAEADLQAALGAQTGAGLLFCRGIAPRSSYLFKQALIQDTSLRNAAAGAPPGIASRRGANNCRRVPGARRSPARIDRPPLERGG
jgi:hypothetical protein